jgi:dienelactone hydrolase/protein tyrosine phosphatase (PTP) superfamily phosphohydrolase (DUF442 family)/quercetin dioxygenase-like cupin family protein
MIALPVTVTLWLSSIRFALPAILATGILMGSVKSAGASESARVWSIPKAEVAGTLLTPPESNPLPCVVILGGTLSQTRDGGLTDTKAPPRNALKRLAEALALAGYASLRFDRVGFGASKSRAGWTGSFRDEAEVAAAVIRWAREQPTVSHVIVAGESAGAYLACLAAAAGVQADAYVFLGGFCGTSHELYDYNFGRLARYAEDSPAQHDWAFLNARRDLALGRHFEAMLAAAEGKDQFEIVDGDFRMTLGLARRREELKWPPNEMFRHIKTPALALAGAADLNVPPEHAWRIAQTIHAAGNTNVAALLLSACDHSFQWLPPDHDRDVAFRERYTFASFKRGYNTNVYAAMIGWLRKVVPSPADPARAQLDAPTTPPWQRAIREPERQTVTASTPERLLLAPGIEIIEDITERTRTAGVETLEGRIGPLLLGESGQAHFIEMPAGMFTEEHPHGSESFIYTVRGRWVLCSQGRRQLMKPGTLFRFGAHISTGYEVPFDAPAFILIFKGERTTGQEKEFMDYLKGMARRLEDRRARGQEIFLLKDLPEDHPARVFARQFASRNSAAANTSGKPQVIASEAIENLHRVGDGLYSGGEPRGEAAFAQLAALGVKTIVTVDGALPDVEAARRHGLRYVHLPLGYNGYSPDACLRLAKAADTFSGPVFVHCHHGKHRGPAAAAIMAMTRLDWTREQAEPWLIQAGTSTNYPGLYATVRHWQRPAAGALASVSSVFPEMARAPDLVQAMVEVDRAWDHLKTIAAAGFRAPPDQPDLVPAREALRLADRLKESGQHSEHMPASTNLRRRFGEAEQQARELARLFAASPLPSESLERQFKIVNQSCTDCHRAFRDRPRTGDFP